MPGLVEREGHEATLLGTVMPIYRSSGQGSYTLCLTVGDGQEYLVENNHASEALKEFVYERVMVHGLVTPGKNEPYLLIDKFELWQTEEDFDIYDYD